MIELRAQTSEAVIQWDWIGDHLGDIWSRSAEHVLLTGVAVGIGLLISGGLALVALRWRATYPMITGAGAILYSIPSLALFALLVPVTGIGPATAVIALVTYTILILVRNIVAGVAGVDPEIREAAKGVGYTRRQVLLRIDLPLSLPVVIGGIRIATVTIVGLVTVTALLGLGGLGFFILDGFRRSILFPTEIIVGIVLSILLAGVLDLALLGMERALSPWTRAEASR